MTSIVTINGKAYTFSGNNITISGNQVMVDGKNIELPEQKNITITIEGDVRDVRVEYCDKLDIIGDVFGNVNTTSGDIDCGDVLGNVSSISGDIDAGRVEGNVSAISGNIRYQRI